MGEGIIERADRRQLDPPLGRHRDQPFDAMLREPGDQVVEERQRPTADVRVLQQAGQPRRHDPERRLAIVPTHSAENTATWKCRRPWPAWSSAHVTYDGLAGSASTTPSATRPAICSDFGPRTPASTGGAIGGGWSSCTSSRSTWRPSQRHVLAGEQPAHGDDRLLERRQRRGGRTPICSIHDCTPWPMPGRTPARRQLAQGGDLHRRDRRVAGDGGEDADARRSAARSTPARSAARLTPAV